MTQENKELLLQDLCARLPYGVKVQVYDNRYAPTTLTAIDIKKQECIFNFNVPIENCLPYLRPMSSMTTEERQFLLKFGTVGMDENDKVFDVYPYGMERTMSVIDFLNACHFDYRDLIEKGLAIEASERIYNLNKK